MDENRVWLDALLNHLHTQEIIYGYLNIKENQESLLRDKGLDDILYLFYVNAIEIYLKSLPDEEKRNRGING